MTLPPCQIVPYQDGCNLCRRQRANPNHQVAVTSDHELAVHLQHQVDSLHIAIHALTAPAKPPWWRFWG